MHGARGIPPAHEDEQADEEIQKAYKPAVILDGSRLIRRSGDDGGLKLAAVAREFVTDLVPESGMPQAAGDLYLRGDRDVVDGDQQVARANADAGGWGVWSQLPSLGAT